MRKPLSGQRPAVQPVNLERTIGAPVGGLNSRDPLAQMKPTDALILDNMICRETSVEMRKGQVNFVTGLAAGEKVWALLPYRAAPADKLFAATDDGIYDVTVTGAVGASVSASTNGKWESINGSNAGIRYLLAVNGTDPMKFYNGTVWADAAITGISSSALFTNISQFKFRVFLTEKGSLSFWYLAVNAVQGAATEFPLAPIFVRGGSLLAAGNWTVDGGNGTDDYAAFITTEGELAIYKGIDPANAATWELVGVYTVPKPIGRKCLYKYGGDLLIITEVGIIPMSQVLQAVSVTKDANVSDKVIGELSTYASKYKANFGWSLTQLSSEGILILNVPLSEGGTSEQFVMNTLTGAWSKFKNMNAFCMAEFGSRLFYGTGQRVVHALTTQADFGANIRVSIMTAYTSMGMQMKMKQVQLLRHNFTLSRNITVNLAIAVNYEGLPYVAPGTTTANTQPLWDASHWDEVMWANADFISNEWRTVAHKPGYVLSNIIQLNDKDFEFAWNASDYLISVGYAFN